MADDRLAGMEARLPDNFAGSTPASDRFRFATLARNPLVRLLAVGLLLQALFLIFVVWPLLIWKHEPSLQTDLFSVAGADLKGALLYAGAALALFAVYIAGYTFSLRLQGRGPFLLVLGFALALAGSLLLIYPAGSPDIFYYISSARLQWDFGSNPYFDAPANHPEDQFSALASWNWLPSPYGPLWHYMSVIPLKLGGGGVIATTIAFKAWVTLFYLATAALIYLIASRIRPERGIAATLLYAWNPLVLFEVAGNGHNGFVMMFFVVLALYLLTSRRLILGGLTLMASALIKYVSLVLAPLVVIWALRRGGWSNLRALTAGFLLGAGLIILLYLPFWEGSSLLSTITDNTEHSLNSVTVMFYYAIYHLVLTDGAEAMSLARAVTFAAFAVAYMAVLIYVWRARVHSFRLLETSFTVFFAFLVIAAFWVMPWYITWAVALAALTTRTYEGAVAITFSMGAAAIYGTMGFGVRIAEVPPDTFYFQALTVFLVFGPASVLWLSRHLNLLSRWPAGRDRRPLPLLSDPEPSSV